MEIHYMVNQFDNVTKKSNRKMLVITNDHKPRLDAQSSDLDIAALVTRTLTPHENFIKEYTTHKSAQAVYSGATLTMDNLLADLRGTKSRQWDAATMVEYDKGTAEHKVLWPNGRAPFQSGTIDERIAAVGGLKQRLADYPALADLLTLVGDFHTILINARDTQQSKEQLVAQASTDLEHARQDIAIMLYRNMGSLMDKFGNEPEQIANYFQISLLQKHSSDNAEVFEGIVAAESTVNITELDSVPTSIVLTNTGNVALTFCLETAASNSCVAGVSLNPGEAQVVTADQLGNDANTFLNVTNASPDTEGVYEVEVL